MEVAAAKKSRFRGWPGGLWVNAGLLGVIAYLLAGKVERVPAFLPVASAQGMPGMAGGGSVSGGAGVYLMPGQLSATTWGVYLLDTESQTLATYVFDTRGNRLKLAAARSYRYDRRLEDFNTADPSPDEVRQLIDRQARIRMNASTQPVSPAGTP